jgi:CheY-like chemotaxis protein
MDGLDTTGAIREAERSRGGHVPILALTAHALGGTRERCLQAGMDDYLAKPIRPAELLEAVERLGQEAESAVRAPDTAARPDRATLLDEVGADAQLLKEIGELFARESAGQMAAVRAAIEHADAQRLARAAHTLRSMLHSVGATAADQLAATLQSLDPRRQQPQAQAVCEHLEQALGAVRESLAALHHDVSRDVTHGRPSRESPGCAAQGR